MKNLSNLIDKNKLYEIYSNVNDSCKFDVGFVLVHDKEWILYELVSPEGNHDGYRIIKSEAIIRLRENTLYLKRLKGIMESKLFVRKPILVSPDNLFMSVLSYIKDKNISPCLTTELAHGTGKNFHPKFCKLIGEYRKPTTLEIFRLMGFTDEEFYKLKKVNSDTKLYEQAGNGIAVNVLEEVLKKLFYNIEICTEKQKTLNTEYDQFKWII